MRSIQIILGAVLVPFLVLTGYVVYEYGFIGFYREATQNAATTLLLVDLVISLALILEWVRRDAKENVRNPIVYNLITYAIGVAGPLLYLLINKTPKSSDSPSGT